MYTEKDIDQLVPYIKGELSEQDHNRIETLISTSGEFNAAYEFEKQLFFATKMDYLDEMREKLNQSSQGFEKKKKANKVKVGLGILAAGLLVSGSLLLFNTTEEEKGDVEIKYNKPEKLVDKSLKNITTNADIQEKKPVKSQAPIRNSPVVKIEQKEISKVEEKLIHTSSIELSNEDTDFLMPSEKEQSLLATKETTVIVSTDSINNKLEKVVTTFDCIAPKVSMKSVSSNFDNSNGELHFRSRHKLQYLLTGELEKYSLNGSFYNLPTGKFRLSVTDSADCSFDIGLFEVGKNSCVEKEDYVFSKTYDQYWEVPNHESPIANLKIMSERGEIVYEIVGNENESVTWKGLKAGDQQAQNGLYKVFVTTKDLKQCIYNVVLED